ncbi:MAG: NADH-quinone oxidoreductase subunit N [Deltaproteobacteria bacterium]|nr:NADH-quinone oxidoreductase subunit N [Deltaproteobacteria bacterium]
MTELLSNISSLVFLFVCAVSLLIIISFKRRESDGSFINTLAIISLVVAIVWEMSELISGKNEYMGHMITVNSFTALSSIILYIIGIITIVITDSFKGFLAEDKGDSSILILLSICGMQIMIISSEFILMLIGLEIASMSIFVLSSRNNRSRLAIEATIKYLVFSSIFFAISLLGIAIVYGFMLSIGVNSDMLSFHNLGFVGRTLNAGNLLLTSAYIFIISIILLKLGIIPFHMWVPDFYEGSPSVVSGFASTSIKVASVVVILNIFSKMFFMPLISDYHAAYKMLEVLTIITIIVSTVVALHQTNVKRLIAYSSIANAALIMLGLLSYLVASEQLRIVVKVNLVFFILVYSLMTLLAFGVFSRLEKEGGGNQLISSFNGLYFKNPFLALSLSVALFSLAGLPPTGGFFAKLFIFKSAIDSGLIVISVVAILMTIVSLYYYLNFVIVMFIKEPSTNERYSGSTLFNFTIGIIVFAILLAGILPNKLIGVFELLLK